jgi:FHA domain
MNTLQPVSVALKFGFLAVLYLFLLWVARSALRDLRGGSARAGLNRSGFGSSSEWASSASARGAGPDATGLYSASAPVRSDLARRAPRLVVARATGHEPGMIYDLDGDLVLGRGDHAEIRLEDPFASSRHAHIYAQAGTLVLEDLGSTNGTYLNEELLDTTPRPLHPGDHLRIGESEFVFEVDG